MACPDTARFSVEAFRTAMEGLELWDALYCPYATALGELTVGTVVYSAFALNIYIRTGSIMIPFILVLVLGGTVLAQMYAVIGAFAGLIILIMAPLAVTGIVYTVDRLG